MKKNIFTQTENTRLQKNKFDLSHDVKLSFNMGQLVPTLAMECVPGDSFRLGNRHLTRFAPMVAPPMQRWKQRFDYYFVPSRLLWDGFERFITQNVEDGPIPAFPTVFFGHDGENYTKLADFLGIPDPSTIPDSSQGIDVSALPFSAYQFIYNEYYRDENLCPKINYKCIDGDNSANAELRTLQLKAWGHDYFTSALPFAQKGPTVSLPIDFKDVPVQLDRSADTLLDGTPFDVSLTGENSSNPDIEFGTMYAKTSELEGSSLISDVRRAFKLQEWLEKKARGGSRLCEFILSMFGVKSPDSRLQRPEFIGMNSAPVIVSEVLQTSASDALTSPQGNMAGHAVSLGDSPDLTYYCQEYGYVICMMHLIPDTSYFQGIPKHFLKTKDAFQYYFQQFAHIGEQEIFQNEIYAYTTTDDDTFGYTPRYAEYKYLPSRICGDFRTTLQYWTQVRKFESVPALQEQFINCVPSMDIFAVEDDTMDKLYCHVYHAISALRPMSYFGSPSI